MSDIQVELKEVTPEQAARILEQNRYPRQRGIRAKQIERLTRAMRKNKFKQGTQITLATLDGFTYLLNGQHTLTAIVESGLSQILSILTQQVASEDELNHLYGTEDRHATRTTNNILVANNLGAKYDMSITALRTIISSARFIEGQFLASRGREWFTDSDLLEYVEQYHLEGREYYAVTSGASAEMRTPLYRASTMSVALVIFKSAPLEIQERCADFFQLVAIGRNESGPVKALQTHLLETGMPGGHAMRSKAVKTVHQSYSCRYVAACWNAFIESRDVVEPITLDRSKPINILYTPYLNPEVGY